jgi:hypothetical protein
MRFMAEAVESRPDADAVSRNLVRHPPGSPRTPGSGRKKGTPNRKSVEARALCSQLVNDARYQAKLRSDFVRRRLHPSIEQMLWNYHLGKPRESVTLTGELTINQRLQAEREVIRASFDVEVIEQLAAESQAMIDRAIALAKALPAPTSEATPQDVAVQGEQGNLPSESLANTTASDNRYSVNTEPITPK